jgi:predicted RNase H-like HicB family nuclease
MLMDGTAGYYRAFLAEETLPSGGHSWFAEHPDLDGCTATGATPDEALANLEKSREVWLTWAKGHDIEVPPAMEFPSVQIQYSARPGAARPRDVASETVGTQRLQVPPPAVAA